MNDSLLIPHVNLYIPLTNLKKEDEFNIIKDNKETLIYLKREKDEINITDNNGKILIKIKVELASKHNDDLCICIYTANEKSFVYIASLCLPDGPAILYYYIIKIFEENNISFKTTFETVHFYRLLDEEVSKLTYCEPIYKAYV